MDIQTIEFAWNEFERAIEQIEHDLDKSKKLKIDLDLLECDLRDIEQKVCFHPFISIYSFSLSLVQSKQSDHLSTIHNIQIKLEEIFNHCQTFSSPNPQTQIVLEKIDQLNLRINIHLTSSFTITNGFNHTTQQQVDQSIIHMLIE